MAYSHTGNDRILGCGSKTVKELQQQAEKLRRLKEQDNRIMNKAKKGGNK